MPAWFDKAVDVSPTISIKDCLHPEKLLTTLSDSDVSFYLAINDMFKRHMSTISGDVLLTFGSNCFEQGNTEHLNELTKGHFYKSLNEVSNAVNKKSTENIVDDFNSFNDYLIDSYVENKENLSLTYEIKNIDENTICVIPDYKESSLVKLSIKDFLVEHLFKMLNQRHSLETLARTKVFQVFVDKL